MSDNSAFLLGGPGLPSGVPSGIAVRVDPNPGPNASAIELVVHSPSAARLDSHNLASAIADAVARLAWNLDRDEPAAEGSEHEEERFVQAQLAGDLERALRDQGLR